METIELLAQAYFNLGITYAKMELYGQAEQEILQAMEDYNNGNFVRQ